MNRIAETIKKTVSELWFAVVMLIGTYFFRFVVEANKPQLYYLHAFSVFVLACSIVLSITKTGLYYKLKESVVDRNALSRRVYRYRKIETAMITLIIILMAVSCHPACGWLFIIACQVLVLQIVWKCFYKECEVMARKGTVIL